MKARIKVECENFEVLKNLMKDEKIFDAKSSEACSKVVYIVNKSLYKYGALNIDDLIEEVSRRAIDKNIYLSNKNMIFNYDKNRDELAKTYKCDVKYDFELRRLNELEEVARVYKKLFTNEEFLNSDDYKDLVIALLEEFRNEKLRYVASHDLIGPSKADSFINYDPNREYKLKGACLKPANDALHHREWRRDDALKMIESIKTSPYLRYIGNYEFPKEIEDAIRSCKYSIELVD